MFSASTGNTRLTLIPFWLLFGLHARASDDFVLFLKSFSSPIPKVYYNTGFAAQQVGYMASHDFVFLISRRMSHHCHTFVSTMATQHSPQSCFSFTAGLRLLIDAIDRLDGAVVVAEGIYNILSWQARE